MKRATTLLAVAMLTATSVGCNCCPCLRNLCPFGSCCGAGAPAPVATYAAVPACPPPAPVCAPAPVYAAAPAMPVYAAPQQNTFPQYAAPAAQPVYSESGCGSSYAAAAPCVTCPQPCMTCPQPCMTCAPPMETGCGMAYSSGMSYGMGEATCPCEAGYGTAPQQMMVDPAPAQ